MTFCHVEWTRKSWCSQFALRLQITAEDRRGLAGKAVAQRAPHDGRLFACVPHEDGSDLSLRGPPRRRSVSLEHLDGSHSGGFRSTPEGGAQTVACAPGGSPMN